MGKDPLVQDIADYGTGALLGVAGQQGANWLMGGADPNPLVSGALMAPALTQALRYGRGRFAPQGSDMAKMNNAMVDRTMASTGLPSYALLGSAASLGGGALTSAQNIAFGGNDIDNNIPASILAAAVPLTAYLINKRKGSTPAPKPPAPKPPNPSDAPGFGYKGEGFSDLFDELEDIKNKFYNR